MTLQRNATVPTKAESEENLRRAEALHARNREHMDSTAVEHDETVENYQRVSEQSKTDASVVGEARQLRARLNELRAEHEAAEQAARGSSKEVRTAQATLTLAEAVEDVKGERYMSEEQQLRDAQELAEKVDALVWPFLDKAAESDRALSEVRDLIQRSQYETALHVPGVQVNSGTLWVGTEDGTKEYNTYAEMRITGVVKGSVQRWKDDRTAEARAQAAAEAERSRQEQEAASRREREAQEAADRARSRRGVRRDEGSTR